MDQAAQQQETTALGLIQQGRFQEAEPLLDNLYQQHPQNLNLLFNLASLKGALGAYEEMIQLLQQMLEQQPKIPEAHFNLGIAYNSQGNRAKAIQAYRNAIRLNPTYAEAQNNLGNLLLEHEELHAAREHLEAAIQANPHHPRAHYNLGQTFAALGDHHKAIACIEQSLRLDPAHSDGYLNLGNAHQHLGDHTEALEQYAKALKLDPNNDNALYNRGVVLQATGELTKAIESYRMALKLNPKSPKTHWNLALTLLQQGDYSEAWPHYEWRTQLTPPLGAHQHPPLPAWTGEALNKQRLIVISEQGLGDSLQFLRYVPTLRDRGFEVQVAAQEPLHGLIRSSGIDRDPITPAQTQSLQDHAWVALLSLPGLLGVTPTQPITAKPYLKAPEPRIKHWAKTLGAEHRPLIGVHWQGNPQAEQGPLKGRSFPLQAMKAIANATEGSLISLQKGPGSEQLAGCSFRNRFVACQDAIDAAWDFAEIAAIMTNCDLIISNDTAVAHLAGGLGLKTWLLLHHRAEWRWAPTNSSTFWYPRMRIFRQQQPGVWMSVMKNVAQELTKQPFH